MSIFIIRKEVLTHDLFCYRVSIHLVSAIFDALFEFAQFLLALVKGRRLLVFAVRRVKFGVVVWISHVSHCRTIATRTQLLLKSS